MVLLHTTLKLVMLGDFAIEASMMHDTHDHDSDSFMGYLHACNTLFESAYFAAARYLQWCISMRSPRLLDCLYIDMLVSVTAEIYCMKL